VFGRVRGERRFLQKRKVRGEECRKKRKSASLCRVGKGIEFLSRLGTDIKKIGFVILINSEQ
jgi:hypothetical protein